MFTACLICMSNICFRRHANGNTTCLRPHVSLCGLRGHAFVRDLCVIIMYCQFLGHLWDPGYGMSSAQSTTGNLWRFLSKKRKYKKIAHFIAFSILSLGITVRNFNLRSNISFIPPTGILIDRNTNTSTNTTTATTTTNNTFYLCCAFHLEYSPLLILILTLRVNLLNT